MTDSEALEVRDLKRKFDWKRNAALKAFLTWWDTLPENKELKAAAHAKCAEYGHEFIQLGTPNPFGYTWKECKYCCARVDIEGPQSQEELADIKPIGEYPIRIPNIPKRNQDLGAYTPKNRLESE